MKAKVLFVLLLALLVAIVPFVSAELTKENCTPENFVKYCCEKADGGEVPINTLAEMYSNKCIGEDHPDLLDSFLKNLRSTFKTKMVEGEGGRVTEFVVGLKVTKLLDEEVKCYRECVANAGIREDCTNQCVEVLDETQMPGAKNTESTQTFTLPELNVWWVAIGLVLLAVIGAGAFFFIRKKENELMGQIKDLKEKMSVLEKDFLRGRMDETTYRRIMEQYTMQLTELKTKLSKMKKKTPQKENQ